MVYNKLVRDRIPDIIRNSGKVPQTRVLNGEAYSACLRQKLEEEVGEYLRTPCAEELADILEVVFALADDLGVSRDELMAVYREKHHQRGGFSEGIYLVSVEDKCV